MEGFSDEPEIPLQISDSWVDLSHSDTQLNSSAEEFSAGWHLGSSVARRGCSMKLDRHIEIVRPISGVAQDER